MNAPAPWHSTGRGFIMMYRFPEEFVRDSCFLPEEWKEMKWSGAGFVMLVDYLDSPVGPYHEILIIPGKTRFDGIKLATISKTYVDSVDSMVNGRNNWGIPRELTNFQWTHEGRNHEIQIGSHDPWFEMNIEVGGIPFPVNTKLLPVHLTQELDGQKFLVSPSGKGTGHFSLVKDISVNPDFFPELNLLEPSVVIYMDPFRVTFPIAGTVR